MIISIICPKRAVLAMSCDLTVKAVGAVGGLLPLVLLMRFSPLKILSAEASCLFVKSPHLIQSNRQARLCRKKNLVSAASREDFFRANPKGLVLTRLVDCSEILAQKGLVVILGT